MFILNLQPILEARGIRRPFTFYRKCGFTYAIASKISRGDVKTLRLDHLERLCMHLKCQPNDIIEWVPDEDYSIDQDHPVWELKRGTEEYVDIGQLMQDLPIDKLKEIQDAIKQIARKKN
ncbi:MAG TPA: hypothetical protein DDY13_06485 [Cytophagales bacterium]|jgi:DNA-binding Xre family transcriptional regulator|nr:hypothetical protein [Cytophagales bacterium]